MSNYTLKNAIEEYQVIDSEYSNDFISTAQASARIDVLNAKCADNSVHFAATVASLEAAPQGVDESAWGGSDEDSYDSWG